MCEILSMQREVKILPLDTMAQSNLFSVFGAHE